MDKGFIGLCAGLTFLAWMKLAKKMYSARERDSRPVVVMGPSGVGKGTLNAMLAKRFNNKFATCISHTTRDPRKGERHGREYYFVTREEFLADVKDGKFIEHADVHGCLYGTSVQAVKDVAARGQICVLEIDIQGATIIKEEVKSITCNYIFIHPPGDAIPVLTERLYNRNTESKEKIEKRLKTAAIEFEKSKTCGFIDLHLVNDDLDRAFTELETYMLATYPCLSDC